ncbi:kinase-like domain-containing protein [Mycena leptocephala]|nr:kinase-like domain-containing protein [Mycena leptocephala]
MFINRSNRNRDKRYSNTREVENTFRLRRLATRLARVCDVPSSLLISDVTRQEEHPSFQGGFGDVFMGKYQGRWVALKRMRGFQTDDGLMRKQFCCEALMWQSLRHDHIVPFIGIDKDSCPYSLCMVSSWMDNGTILQYLSGFNLVGRSAVILRLIQEVADGLGFLHQQHIVHGDLRGTNILVDGDGHARLVDFGLTALFDATPRSSSHRAGSVRWMAPELLNPSAFTPQIFLRSPASDIYAYGCVCLEMYTGQPPFFETFKLDAPVMLQVIDGTRPARPADSLIPDYIWGLIEQCWAHDISVRPEILEIQRVLCAGMEGVYHPY